MSLPDTGSLSFNFFAPVWWRSRNVRRPVSIGRPRGSTSRRRPPVPDTVWETSAVASGR
jgi:hypothetical protein